MPVAIKTTWTRSRRGNLWQRIDEGEPTEITVSVFKDRCGEWFNVYFAGSCGRKLCLNDIAKTETDACKRAEEWLLRVWDQWQ